MDRAWEVHHPEWLSRILQISEPEVVRKQVYGAEAGGEDSARFDGVVAGGRGSGGGSGGVLLKSAADGEYLPPSSLEFARRCRAWRQ